MMRAQERETIRRVGSFKELVILRRAYMRDLARQRRDLSGGVLALRDDLGQMLGGNLLRSAMAWVRGRFSGRRGSK